MPSSSKRPRASSSDKSGAGKPRTLSVSRTDTLPRKSNASAARRKPVAVETETVATRTKTTRAAGRRSRKADDLAAPAAMAPAVEQEIVAAPEPVAAVDTEIVVEASAIVEETTIGEVPLADRAPPAAPVPHRGKRPLETAVSRLFSALSRWIGVRP